MSGVLQELRHCSALILLIIIYSSPRILKAIASALKPIRIRRAGNNLNDYNPASVFQLTLHLDSTLNIFFLFNAKNRMSPNWCKNTVLLSFKNESFHVKYDKLCTLARLMEDVVELSYSCCCFQRLKWFPRYRRHRPQKSKLMRAQFSFLLLLLM